MKLRQIVSCYFLLFVMGLERFQLFKEKLSSLIEIEKFVMSTTNVRFIGEKYAWNVDVVVEE